MLAPRKGLMLNLNNVHLQHVSLGVHLSLQAELKEKTLITGSNIHVVMGANHGWKEGTDTSEVDANSNDPSVPCLCCEQHTKQMETCNNSCQDNLDPVTSDEEPMSPIDLPLSPLSTSSPSSNSDSSSDFTLDDSPVSMYYKEFSQDVLESPDQQPDIIPLDAANEDSMSPTLQSSMWVSPDSVSSPLSCGEMRPATPEPNTPDNVESYNTYAKSDWASNTALDANCNNLPESEHSTFTHTISRYLDDVDSKQTLKKMTCTEIKPNNKNTAMNVSLLESSNVNSTQEVEEEMFPGLSFPRDVPSQSPKKYITSFHELAQRRRRSGGGQGSPQVKKDKSDWLITFSPDTEYPPVNELTTSAFKQGSLWSQTQPPTGGKEVVTFRELRYRNNLIKQSSQSGKNLSVTEMVSQTSVTEREGMHCTSAAREVDQDQGWRELSPKGLQQSTTYEEKINIGELGVVNVPFKVDHTSNMWRLRSSHLQPTFQENISNGHMFIQPEKGPLNSAERTCIRGTADGGDKRWREAGLDKLLMAERGEDPLHKEKKGLLVAISSSVDKIICHFNTSRNLVQKARLGDSRLSPELGYLILNSLCPSLYALLNNGLRPFQKDVILGRRRLSPWSLVEASVKPGSTKETIHNLFCAVSHLSQLRDPKRRFNAFIFGLLNTKQLDTWISHMNQNYDLFSIFFDPTAFQALASASNPELYEELLLTLQPLSALTFHLDLLFEHHHLPLPDPSVSPRLVTHGQGDTWGRASLQHIFHWGGQLAHSLVHNAEQKRFPAGRDNSQNRSTLHTDISQDQSALSRDSPQDSYSLLSDTPQDSQSSPSDTPQDVPSSSNKIKHDSSSPDGENTDGLSPPVSEITQDLSSCTTEIQQNLQCASKEEEHGSSCSPKDNQQDLLVDKKNATQVLSPLSSETAQELISSLSDTIHNVLSPHSETPQDSNSSWWGHLAQASRVYMPSSIETFPFTRWSKLRTWGTPEREQEATNVKQEGITGKGETFEITSPNTTKIVDCREEPALDQYIMESSRTFPHTHIGPTQKNAYCTTYSSHIKTAELPQNTEGWGSWFGHLFGANTFPNKEMETKNVKSRRPSSWLQPNINVFDLVKKPLMPERLPLPQKASGDGHQNSSKHERSLRALCDHASSDQTHLSFRRGDILQLLDTVDEDWIRCQRGRDTGLVPVGYTSLIL